MNLNTFYLLNGIDGLRRLSDATGLNERYLYQLATGFQGRRVPSHVAMQLQAVTDGALTAREMRPDLPWPGQPEDCSKE